MKKIDLGNIDLRYIYLFVFLLIATPLIFRYSIPPAPMKVAETTYDLIENLEVKDGQVAFVAMDFGPNTKAENEPQVENVIEHLMRRRIPVAVFTQYVLGQGFLDTVPQRVADRLNKEMPDERWVYGVDWVNLGFKPGGGIFLQNLAKSKDLAVLFGKDSYGRRLQDVPAFQGVKTIKDIAVVAEFTGLTGVFDSYIQFFQTRDYVPPLVHGCTSITIPEAYIFLDSGQIKGLFEGVSGAAWYSEILQRNNPNRVQDSAREINTALGISQLGIIFLIILGNLGGLLSARKGGQG